MAISALSVFCQIATVQAQEFVKSDFWVSDSSGYNYHASQLSVSNSGDMVVAWETTGGGDILFKSISGQGTQLGDQKSVKSPYSLSVIRLAHSDSGNFMLMYNGYLDRWKVIGQLYDPEGNEVGDTMTISRNTTEMINMYWSTLSAESNGVFGAFLPGLDSVIVEKINSDGSFVGNSIVLKPSHGNFQNHTGIMTYSGQLILVWVSYVDGNIHGQRFTPEGIPIDTAFQVSQKEESHFIQDIALSSDTSGNFVVAWSTSKDSTTNMYSQLFTAEGMAVGSNTLITGGYHSIKGQISVSMDQDGDFITAWEDTRHNDTSFIYMQQVDHMGVKIGDNYRATSINNHMSNGQIRANQVHPDVRLLRDTIYLAWVNYNMDIHYRSCIYASIQKWRVPVTGLKKLYDTSVQTTLFPNPSAGIVTLIMDHEYTGPVELKVYNASGTLVRRDSRTWSGPEISLDLSEEPAGLYYINLTGDSFHSSKPLVIVK
jgi:hypothetical protein